MTETRRVHGAQIDQQQLAFELMVLAGSRVEIVLVLSLALSRSGLLMLIRRATEKTRAILRSCQLTTILSALCQAP